MSATLWDAFKCFSKGNSFIFLQSVFYFLYSTATIFTIYVCFHLVEMNFVSGLNGVLLNSFIEASFSLQILGRAVLK